MNKISDIKNKNLRDFLSTNPNFTNLSEAKKTAYVDKLATFPEQEQEEVFKRLVNEIKKAEIVMLKGFHDRIVEIEKRLKKVGRLVVEDEQKDEDTNKMENLLNELNQKDHE